jgi:hypothetical protein
MIVQAGKNVGEPGLRIDVVEFGSLDQGVDCRRATATGIRRDLIMPGVWGKKLRLHIHSTRCFNGLRS